MNDDSSGLIFSVAKVGRLVCHAGSGATGFIQDIKLIVRSKSKTSTDYDNEMTSETFKSGLKNSFSRIFLLSLLS